MSNKIETLAKIQEVGIVAVVRATSIEQAEKITDACIAGGVAAIELTFTVPHADKLIEAMRAKYSSVLLFWQAQNISFLHTLTLKQLRPVTVTVFRQCRVFTLLQRLFTLWNAAQTCLRYFRAISQLLHLLRIFTVLFLMRL